MGDSAEALKVIAHPCKHCLRGKGSNRHAHQGGEFLELQYGRTKVENRSCPSAVSCCEPHAPHPQPGEAAEDAVENVSLTLNGCLYGGDSYQGEWCRRQPNGQGSMVYDDGRRFIGDWKDGKRHGKGYFRFASGHEYDGEWANDRQTGMGIYRWPEGQWHEGKFLDGKMNGPGTRYHPSNGCIEEGQWLNDRRHSPSATSEAGESKLVLFRYSWDDGATGVAQWIDGNLVTATYRGSDGRACEIRVRDNASSSESENAWLSRSWISSSALSSLSPAPIRSGSLSPSPTTAAVLLSSEVRWPSDGMIYRGKMEKGCMQGRGTLVLPNGSSFDGEFRADVPLKGAWQAREGTEDSSPRTLDELRKMLFLRRFPGGGSFQAA